MLGCGTSLEETQSLGEDSICFQYCFILGGAIDMCVLLSETCKYHWMYYNMIVLILL